MSARTSRWATGGFTLIEVLVALMAMALMAGLGWRGIDGLLRARAASQARVDQVSILQTALAQWQSDLDSATSVPGNPGIPGLSWDGRVLRILRRASVPDANGADAGLWVVSWSLRALTPDEAEQIGLPRLNPHLGWVRTQSAASADRPTLQQGWDAALSAVDRRSALQGVSAPGGSMVAAGPTATAVFFPVQQWQLFYYRGDAWSNPLSSSGPVSVGQDAAIPDGVRLLLTLPETASPSGVITLDWVRPSYATLRS